MKTYNTQIGNKVIKIVTTYYVTSLELAYQITAYFCYSPDLVNEVSALSKREMLNIYGLQAYLEVNDLARRKVGDNNLEMELVEIHELINKLFPELT